MPETQCGFKSVPGGAPAHELLAAYSPTLLVDIGFDPDFRVQTPPIAPVAGITKIRALVDSGAAESCIDSMLATRLGLPIVDRRPLSGIHGTQLLNIHIAQIHVPSLNFTLYGPFAAVHLEAGGQWHGALIGRTFLKHCTMTYEGRTGVVKISTG